jgi:hypothetical protein
MSAFFERVAFESQAAAAFAALSSSPARAAIERVRDHAWLWLYRGRWALQFFQEDLNIIFIAHILKDFKLRARGK